MILDACQPRASNGANRVCWHYFGLPLTPAESAIARTFKHYATDPDLRSGVMGRLSQPDRSKRGEPSKSNAEGDGSRRSARHLEISASACSVEPVPGEPAHTVASRQRPQGSPRPPGSADGSL